MVLDLNIELLGIDEEFLEDLEDFIEDYRVELFIMNPKTEDELERAKQICKFSNRFRYTAPVQLKAKADKNCVALQIKEEKHLDLLTTQVVMIESKDLTSELIEKLNSIDVQGVVLNAREKDSKLNNFILGISNDSLRHWSKEALTALDLKKLAVASNYPKHSYDELFVMIKKISDLTFRAEQSITAGGTRGALKLFSLM